MPMSPRLLRPRASGEFDPRTIAGCICNLDASVLSSLAQSSDGTTAATATDHPIGYWGDLSGLGNHAKQTVATGSRPFLKLNNQNGRPGLLFDGSNDWLTATIAGFQSLAGVTIAQVVKTTNAAAADTNTAVFWGFGNAAAASSPYPASRGIALISVSGAFSGEYITGVVDKGAGGRLGSSTYRRSANSAQFLLSSFGGSGTLLFANQSDVTIGLADGVTTTTASGPTDTAYTVDNDLHIGAFRASGAITTSPAITVHQMIVYNRVLTLAERQSLGAAMIAKWGIT